MAFIASTSPVAIMTMKFKLSHCSTITIGSTNVFYPYLPTKPLLVTVIQIKQILIFIESVSDAVPWC